MLDTNALSAWADSDPLLLRVLPKNRLWQIPVIALGEFLFGVRRSRRRAILEAWLREVIATCTLVAVDAGTAARYAEIREELRSIGTPIPENDLWIASLCRQHEVALASRDAHFDNVAGLKRVSW